MGVLLAALLLTLRPQALGGSASYITVDQPGLEPVLFPGDLAIVRHRDDYQVGDLIAVETVEGAYFGRIIGLEEAGYRVVFQGTADAIPVGSEYIIGRVWLNVGVLGRRINSNLLDAFGLNAEAAR
jgi:hypothetical protein